MTEAEPGNQTNLSERLRTEGVDHHDGATLETSSLALKETAETRSHGEPARGFGAGPLFPPQTRRERQD